jgi:hypothetical protein
VQADEPAVDFVSLLCAGESWDGIMQDCMLTSMCMEVVQVSGSAAALCSSGTQTQPNVLNRHPDTVTLIAACGMPHGCTVPWKAIVHSAHIPATRK